MPFLSVLRAMSITLLVVAATAIADAPLPAGTAGGLRIVSLSPAISRTLVDLGVGDRVVGRTPWCRSLDADVPVVGDLHQLDYERLLRVHPTHVLLQPTASGPAPLLLELGRSRGFEVRAWPHLDTVENIRGLIRDLPAVLAARDTPAYAGLARRSAGILSRLDAALAAGYDSRYGEPVLLVGGIHPLLAFGRKTYLHDILVHLGGRNAISGDGWIQLSLEDVTRIDPRAIVYAAADAGTSRETESLLRSLPVSAAQTGRIAPLSGTDALLPSSAIVEVATELRHLLDAFSGGRNPGTPVGMDHLNPVPATAGHR